MVIVRNTELSLGRILAREDIIQVRYLRFLSRTKDNLLFFNFQGFELQMGFRRGNQSKIVPRVFFSLSRSTTLGFLKYSKKHFVFCPRQLE